jgi:hypothetical protein
MPNTKTQNPHPTHPESWVFVKTSMPYGVSKEEFTELCEMHETDELLLAYLQYEVREEALHFYGPDHPQVWTRFTPLKG